MKKNTNLNERPINPKTGKVYGTKTKKYKEWFDNLYETDKNIISDLTYKYKW